LTQFSVLREEAGLEILDIVDEFAATFDEVLSWESGRKKPPEQLLKAMSAKDRRRTSADVPENCLFEGDCLEILPTLPGNSINLILCDLPYGTTQNRWDSVIDLEKLWAEYRRILKPNGAVVLTSQGVFTAKIIMSNEQWFKYKIVWEKSKPTNFLNAKKQPLRKHEDICVFYGKPPTYNPQMRAGKPYDKGIRKDQLSGSYGDFSPVHVKSSGDRYPSDIVYFKTAESEPGRTVWHPTQKPVELGRYLVRTFSNSGDVVLDNAFGSGSFLVAAALEGRKFIGIEKNQEVHHFKEKEADYLDIAQYRLRDINPNVRLVRP
jgi:site-specific DNA-methyltransferase (adenine-specific)